MAAINVSIIFRKNANLANPLSIIAMYDRKGFELFSLRSIEN
jgi:hypothetical protein